jgi:hypothetical protein
MPTRTLAVTLHLHTPVSAQEEEIYTSDDDALVHLFRRDGKSLAGDV